MAKTAKKTAKKSAKKAGKKTASKKRGPKDRSYVNRKEKHETDYESKRKTPAKKFGSGSKKK